ncbi:MAG: hypothetical protein ACOZQL_04845 [Myxococcota bacterium]
MTTRWLVLVAALAMPAFADVPGPKTDCDVPAGCVSCATSDQGCISSAQDAGLILSDCVSTRGTPTSYVCPSGHPALRTCGCTSGGVGAGLFAAVLLLRRRAR